MDSKDTAPPPLPSWLRGFLVTVKTKDSMRLAGQEIENLLNSKDFPHHSLYEKAEALLVPGCPGTVFVALRPDDADAQGRQNVRLIAETLIKEIDREYEAAEAFCEYTKTETIPLAPHVARILPVERVAPETDIDRVARHVIDEHFPKIDANAAGTRNRASSKGLPSFRVRYEAHSPAARFGSAEIEKRIADLVPDEYAVNLETPDETILVVVAGASVLMSVVQGYDAEEKFHHFRVARKSTYRSSLESPPARIGSVAA